MSEMSTTSGFAASRDAYGAKEAARRARFGLYYVWVTPLLIADTLLPGAEFGGFNLNGWVWVVMLIVGLCLLLLNESGDAAREVRQPCQHWLAWIGLLWISLLWCNHVGLANLRQACQISMPVLVAAVSSKFIRTENDLRILLRSFVWSLLPLGAGILLIAGGIYQDEGMVRRALALSVALVGCVFLAASSQKPVLNYLGWLGCLLLILLSSSRMAAVALLGVIVLHPAHSRGRRLLSAVMMIVCGLAVFYSPMFQERTFYEGQGTLSDLSSGEQVDTAGRSYAWPLIWDEAWKDPILGKGAGSSRDFVMAIWDGVEHPHNDYLRVGFECGLVGLAIYLGAVLWQLFDLQRKVTRSTGVIQTAFAAAFLGFLVMLITSYSDNTIVYNVTYTDPLFALMGGAYGAFSARAAEAPPA